MFPCDCDDLTPRSVMETLGFTEECYDRSPSAILGGKEVAFRPELGVREKLDAGFSFCRQG